MVGLCLVGPGAIATAHMTALRSQDRCCRRWVVGESTESAARFAQDWDFDHYSSELDPALSDPALDVVLIASPSPLHASQASLALSAGKHVITEIPAALKLADAEQLSALAREANCRLLVCHTMRSYPSIKEVRRRVLAGELTVSQVNGFFAIPRRSNDHWISGQRSWVDNLLWHHACHQVDASLWALGIEKVEAVSAQFGKRHPEFGMIMDLSLAFRTKASQLVTQTLTYNAADVVWELRFVADQDLLTFQDCRLLDGRGNEIVAGTDWSDLSAQDGEMLAAIANGTESDYEIASTLPVMRILHEAELVAGAGR